MYNSYTALGKKRKRHTFFTLIKCMGARELYRKFYDLLHCGAYSLAKSIIEQHLEDEERFADFHIQSSEEVIDASEHKQEVTSFYDLNPGPSSGMAADKIVDEIGDSTPSVDLKDFLARPVRIHSFTWNESDSQFTEYGTIAPWHLFFNDTRIKYKLNNFGFLKADLKIKILVNASPFYYGALLASYQPLPNYTASTISTNNSAASAAILRSQRPHLWIYPQHNTGGEMTLPFFYQKNFVRVQVAQDFTDLGTMSFKNYTTLQSANGATGTGVTVSVYAWAENVILSGPTVALALQSDEYEEGPVSSIASNVASAASWFTNIPIIGKFAKATQIGAGAIGTIASMFGFTNVPVIESTKPLKPNPFPNMSSSEISYPIEKLTLDPKNELTIDPSHLGLSNEDELSIPYLVQKESWLTNATFSTTNAIDDIIFSTKIAPHTFYSYDNVSIGSGVTAKCIAATPIAWVSQNFSQWRGDVIIRVRAICSKYHKGRLRVTYDPQGLSGNNIFSDVNTSTVCFTKIIDLEDTMDYEFRVPYQQALAWLGVETLLSREPTWSTSASPTWTTDDTHFNGTLTIRVLNKLTAPIASSSISVMISVRGAENLEFANPGLRANYSHFTLQSGDSDEQTRESTEALVGYQPIVPVPERFLINFGECIPSLRPLMRRMMLNSTITPVFLSNGVVLNRWTTTRFPLEYGYDPHGFSWAQTATGSDSYVPFNYSYGHFFNYIASAYVGVKGSFNWTYNLENTEPNAHLRVIRLPEATLSASAMGSVGTPLTSRSTVDNFIYKYSFGGSAGSSLTSQYTNSGLNVQVPMYTNYRFQTTCPANITAPTSTDGGNTCAHAVEYVTTDVTPNVNANARLWTYCGAGTDMNLYFFLNVPSMFIYSAVPDPDPIQ